MAKIRRWHKGRGGVTKLITGTEIRANFDKDGQLTGSSGCNNYTATYENEGENTSIGRPATTCHFCAEPEGIMDREGEYLAAFQTAATYLIEANSLNMRRAGASTVANFSRSSG